MEIPAFLYLTYPHISCLLAAETTEAEAAVKTMSPGRRKCLLTSETDVEDMYTMKLFHEYKKSSCLLECK